MPESSQVGDALHHFRISRFLKRNDIGTRRLDHLGYRFRAADAALANVVSEESHATLPSRRLSHAKAGSELLTSSLFGFFRSTRYG